MRILASAILACVVTACGGDNLNGKWKGTGTLTAGTTNIPYTSTATFSSATHLASVELDLPAAVGGGTITVSGTYAESGTNLKLSNIVVAASTGTGTVDAAPPANYTCVALTALGSSICFDTPQTSPYTVNGTTLTISVTFGFRAGATVPESATPATVTFTKQ